MNEGQVLGIAPLGPAKWSGPEERHLANVNVRQETGTVVMPTKGNNGALSCRYARAPVVILGRAQKTFLGPCCGPEGECVSPAGPSHDRLRRTDLGCEDGYHIYHGDVCPARCACRSGGTGGRISGHTPSAADLNNRQISGREAVLRKATKGGPSCRWRTPVALGQHSAGYRSARSSRKN